MSDHNLNILYLDDDLLILNKPAGLLTVPGKGPEKQDCLINRALKFNPNARVVHRLDQGTSGIVMFPLNYMCLRLLTKQFEARGIHKHYVAVVAGLVEQDQGEVQLPLICDWPNRPLQKVCFDSGKPAHTRYQVLERYTSPDASRNATRVRLEPVSGRTHQLRVHMLSLGHPMLGDQLYSPPEIQAQASRLLLHAQHIQLTHPITRVKVEVECKADF
ncbi:MAG TPA: pseudouridine synthase [Cellvibrio sp.]|nr:pseudouridine synthase [Cellvibrio sp.]